MGTVATPTRDNRTITVDFRDEATYFHLLSDGKAFLECVLAFLMALGFQLKHKANPNARDNRSNTPLLCAAAAAQRAACTVRYSLVFLYYQRVIF